MVILGQPFSDTSQMILKVSRGDSEMSDGTSGGVEKKSDSGYIYLEGSTGASAMGAMGAFSA